MNSNNWKENCNIKELRHYKRPYTLPGVFEKGDLNPPMLRVEQWISSDYNTN
jgi:hypothetical protein